MFDSHGRPPQDKTRPRILASDPVVPPPLPARLEPTLTPEKPATPPAKVAAVTALPPAKVAAATASPPTAASVGGYTGPDALAPWFYDDGAKKASQQALDEARFRDGAFVVRTSKSRPGEFMLVLCHGGGPHNYRIKARPTDNHVSLDDAQFFPSLVALLQHYGTGAAVEF